MRKAVLISLLVAGCLACIAPAKAEETDLPATSFSTSSVIITAYFGDVLVDSGRIVLEPGVVSIGSGGNISLGSTTDLYLIQINSEVSEKSFLSVGGQLVLNDAPNGIWLTTAQFENSVDNGLVLQAIPEPESWAMLLAGLGLIGVANRRRIHFS